MGAFVVVVEMRCPEEGLVATIAGAYEKPLIVVRAQVLLKTRRAIKRLCTSLEGAEVGFQL